MRSRTLPPTCPAPRRDQAGYEKETHCAATVYLAGPNLARALQSRTRNVELVGFGHVDKLGERDLATLRRRSLGRERERERRARVGYRLHGLAPLEHTIDEVADFRLSA